MGWGGGGGGQLFSNKERKQKLERQNSVQQAMKSKENIRLYIYMHT